MTDNELKQLIESNARAIQGNSQNIRDLTSRLDALAEQARRTEVKLERLNDIVLGNHRHIVKVETSTLNNESAWLDTLAQIQQLERRIETLEQQ